MRRILLLILTLVFCNNYSQTISKHLEDAHKRRWDDDDYKNILDDYNNAIVLDTVNCSYLYFQRGEIKSYFKDFNGAILDYRTAIEYDLNCTYEFIHNDLILITLKLDLYKIYFARGRVKFEMQDYIGAISDFNQVIKLTTNYDDVYYKRAKTKAELKDFRGAIEDYNKVLVINPKYTVVYYDRGNAKFDLKNYQGAILDYSKRIQLYPDSPEEYFNRGLAKLNLNQKDSACLDFSKAGELGYAKAYETIKKYCN